MDIHALVASLTLEEKACLCSGINNSQTKPIPRLSVPRLRMHDGPNGLRKQRDDEVDENYGSYRAVPATCFPSGCALASSWDEALVEQAARAMGEECQAEGLPILLGPSVNIKRSPLGGRNFEYLSEDPYLAGKLAAAYIRGVQSQGIGAGLKHFAANSQERRRMSVDEIIDERTLREIYLTNFEIAVKEGGPWAVMCAYNRINGAYCCENPRLLTDILRGEWGFEGFVVSDWGAVNDRVASLAAGLELEMPYSGEENDRLIVEAVRAGRLEEAVLDRAVERLLRFVYRGTRFLKPGAAYDKEAHHALARRVAAECMVLLKNEDSILPLPQGEPVALIGEFAQSVRFQGGGSAHVVPTRLDSVWQEARAFAPAASYAQGYRLESDAPDEALIAQAADLARRCPRAVVFAGLPERCESEGFDRDDMRMPPSQLALIEAVAAANPNTVVVLLNGSPVEMPFAGAVKGILEAYLGGQAAGGAIADLLFGAANPCGKLAESFPLRLAHNPSHLNYALDSDRVEYHEGVFVGYRYYDTKEMEVRFPFGHGLSYTTFGYAGLSLAPTPQGGAQVRLTVKNTGNRPGKEVVQLYVGDPAAPVPRPEKELRAFAKVALAPGEEREVCFTLPGRAFAYYDEKLRDWRVWGGTYRVLVGASSRDIRLEGTLRLPPSHTALPPVDENTTVGEVQRSPARAAVLEEMMRTCAPALLQHYTGQESATENCTRRTLQAMYEYMPLRVLHLFSLGTLSLDALRAGIARMNEILE